MNKRKMNNGTLQISDAKDNIILSITEKVEDGRMDVTLEGKIQNDVSFEFEDEITAALMVCKNVRLDFSKVTYIASDALDFLLKAQRMVEKNDDSEMVLVKVSAEVMKILKETGFSELLMIEEE